MKNLLAFVAAAVIVFLGVGWYLDWFRVVGAPSPAGHRAYHVDVNTDKIGTDVHKGEQKVIGAVEKARAEAEAQKAATDKTGGEAKAEK